MQIFKDGMLYVVGNAGGGREFQSLEIVGINRLANVFIYSVSIQFNRIEAWHGSAVY